MIVRTWCGSHVDVHPLDVGAWWRVLRGRFVLWILRRNWKV